MTRTDWPQVADYQPGVTAFPPTRPQDAKSPPLDSLWPGGAPQTLDLAMFRSRDWMAAEGDAIWRRAWICAGLESDAREPGQWFSFRLLDRSLLIVRGQDGVLRAPSTMSAGTGARHSCQGISAASRASWSAAFTAPSCSRGIRMDRWMRGKPQRDRKESDDGQP